MILSPPTGIHKGHKYAPATTFISGYLFSLRESVSASEYYAGDISDSDACWVRSPSVLYNTFARMIHLPVKAPDRAIVTLLTS